MYRPTKRAFTLVLMVAIVLLLAIGVQASSITGQAGDEPLAQAEDGLVLTTTVSPADQAAALSFWTRDAIGRAQPMDILIDYGPAEVDQASISAQEALGPYGFTKSGTAARGADLVAQSAYAADWGLSGQGVKGLAPDQQNLDGIADGEAAVPDADQEATGTSQVYTSYNINKFLAAQKIYPHKFVGRLSFSTPAGTSYCSATSISGNNMLTAAHCVYDTGTNHFYSNWAFTPAYRNGNAPYGTFVATQCAVLTAWANLAGGYNINTWAPHDVAICKMGNNSAGQTLNGAVGFMGREWNASYIRHVHNMGYPFKNFNNVYIVDPGLYLLTCVAETFQQAAEVRGMGCNHGGGISGGPWATGYALNVVSGRATTVNSGIFIGTQNIYGGRFNSNNIVPLCTAMGC